MRSGGPNREYKETDAERGIKRIVGGYSEGVHLFPFRTEKLSPSAPMVLPLGGRVGHCQLYESSFR